MGKFSGTDGVGIIWWRREDYGRVLRTMTDRRDMPPTYEEWLERANEVVAFVKREGGKPVIVEASLDKVVTYCALRGLGFDADGRNNFASDPGNWPASGKH